MADWPDNFESTLRSAALPDRGLSKKLKSSAQNVDCGNRAMAMYTSAASIK